MLRCCCLVFFLMLTACGNAPSRAAYWAQPIADVPIENFHQVTLMVFRSAQPSPKGVQAVQKRFTIRSVLNLRQFHDTKPDTKVPGVSYYQVRMNAGHVDPVAVKAALNIIRTAPKPILIHSWHGADRTGLVIAAYRIAEQGWTIDQAVDELEHGDYGYNEAVFPGIVSWLRSGGVDRL